MYSLILLGALFGVIYGFMHLSPTEFKVLHERQPLFVQLSDGSIQNKYTLKLLNKTKEAINVRFNITGLEGASLIGLDEITVESGKVVPVTAFVRLPAENITSDFSSIVFEGRVISDDDISLRYKSMFIAPTRDTPSE